MALAEVIKAAEKTQTTLNLLLVTIAALALTIAGVGVMNMMLRRHGEITESSNGWGGRHRQKNGDSPV
jgi:hypothetical protein